MRAAPEILKSPCGTAGVPGPRGNTGEEPREDDVEPFEAKMTRLVTELRAQQAEGARPDAAIAENLKRLGFGWRDDTEGETPS